MAQYFPRRVASIGAAVVTFQFRSNHIMSIEPPHSGAVPFRLSGMITGTDLLAAMTMILQLAAVILAMETMELHI